MQYGIHMGGSMTYGALLPRDEAERRIRILAAQGWKVRDLASVFGLHPLVIVRIVGRGPAD
jgi:hypothetical protein